MTKKRKDINTLDKSALADYIHAINIMRARSSADPGDMTGYDYQARLHNDVFVGPCEHGNDHFLAWHRAHLYYFEKLLQEADPPRTTNVTIPYWDWLHTEATGKFPIAFEQEQELIVSWRNNTAGTLPPDTIEIVTKETNWSEFGGYPKGDQNGDYGRLERGPHNDMHATYIGGPMWNPATAAEDPIYWSFHAFIDLLWAEWQRRNNMPAPTTPDGSLRGFAGKSKNKISDFQKTIDLDYEYEYTPKLLSAFGVSRPLQQERKLLAVEPLHPLFPGALNMELQDTGRAQFAMPTPPPATSTTVVRLSNLKVPITGSYTLQAYVHPEDVPFEKNDPAFWSQYGVGYTTLWKSHEDIHQHSSHAGHGGGNPQAHHPTSCTVRFDVTKPLVAIGDGALSDLVLTLNYIPSPGPTGESRPEAELIEEVQLQDVMLEAYT